MLLNEFGTIAHDEWVNLSERYPNVTFDIFQIMPNHIHGIIALSPVGATLAVAQNDNAAVGATLAVAQNAGTKPRAGTSPAPTAKMTIGNIVGAYKSLVANKCLEICKSRGEYTEKLWQRNYHEHIIRDNNSHQNIIDYIANNPAKWESDTFYTEQ
jgi:REP element-mobilizing transposase RayT